MIAAPNALKVTSAARKVIISVCRAMQQSMSRSALQGHRAQKPRARAGDTAVIRVGVARG
jgi:hypothetical protein